MTVENDLRATIELIVEQLSGPTVSPLSIETDDELVGRLVDRIGELVARADEHRVGELEARIRAILESVPEGVLTIDAAGRVETMNREAERMFGLEPDGALGRPISELVPAPGKDGELETVALRADGTEFPIELRIDDCRVGDHRLITAIVCDLSQKKQSDHERWHLEQNLQRAQKLESVGQLAAGIAHEINTPTQFISDNTFFVRDSFAKITPILTLCEEVCEAGEKSPEEFLKELAPLLEQANVSFLAEEVPDAIEEAIHGIDRVTKIVSAMRDFSHPGSEEKEMADLNHAIQSTLTVATNEWKYVAEVEIDLDESLPPVPCYLDDMNQVVLNMVVNASHAIGDVIDREAGEKGKISVSTKHVDDMVEVRIADSGSGIPQEVVEKIFDPFFTTKEVGKGTGQGLAISHAVVVEKHGGTIDVETSVGAGTTFVIRLPLTTQPVAPLV